MSEMIMRIRQAEDSAAERLLDAKAQAKHIVEAADAEGRKRAAEILNHTIEEEKALLAEARRRAEMECSQIAKTAQAEADSTIQKASQKLDSAIQIITVKVVG